MTSTPILVGADHRGFALKGEVIAWLTARGYAPADLGAHSAERCDALDIALAMADGFSTGAAQRGVLICGTGQAMAMTANRHGRLRAALCTSAEMARLAREHNDANILALGADLTPPGEALRILEVFLTTDTLGGRYADRRKRLDRLGGL